MPAGNGVLIQLAAYGAQDVYLTGNPQITFFVAVYKRHTHFAVEEIEEVFLGDPQFGKKVYVNLGRYGDLVGNIYVRAKLPELPSTPNISMSWVNSIGNALIKEATVEIGGITVEKQYGQWMEIWGELTVPASLRRGYDDMIGHHENFNAFIQPGPLDLFVPLQFWFCRNKGLSLPLIALQNHQVRVEIVFQEFNNLMISNTGQDYFEITGEKEGPKMVEAMLLVSYIYLDDFERRWFALNPHEYLIDLIYQNVYSTDLVSIDSKLELPFNHPVKELIWIVQDNTFCSNIIPNGGNEFFNFSDRSAASNTPPEDPMVEARILFDGRDRICDMDAKYFRVVQPYEHHTNVPDNFIYVYSFAYSPENYQPSGTANFSRLDTASLNIRIKSMDDPTITIYAPYYNILRIREGMAGVVYAD